MIDKDFETRSKGGKKGGKTVLKKYGRKHFSEMGKARWKTKTTTKKLGSGSKSI